MNGAHWFLMGSATLGAESLAEDCGSPLPAATATVEKPHHRNCCKPGPLLGEMFAGTPTPRCRPLWASEPRAMGGAPE